MREWNTRIFLSFLTASSVAVFSVVAWTNFEPLSWLLRALTILSVLMALITGPLLTYFGESRRNSRWSFGGIMLPVFCSTMAVILYYNGKHDSTPLSFKEATILELESRTAKMRKVFKVHVRLIEPPGSKITVWTTQERFEQLAPGMVIGIPSKAGALGIPRRIKDEPIRLIRK